MKQSGKSHGGLINITHNDAIQTKWLLSSHIVANYTEPLRDLTRVTPGTWSEQHRDVQASRGKENSIATGVITSDDNNADSAVDIGTKIVSGLDGKKLGEIALKRKDHQKRLQQ